MQGQGGGMPSEAAAGYQCRARSWLPAGMHLLRSWGFSSREAFETVRTLAAAAVSVRAWPHALIYAGPAAANAPHAAPRPGAATRWSRRSGRGPASTHPPRPEVRGSCPPLSPPAASGHQEQPVADRVARVTGGGWGGDGAGRGGNEGGGGGAGEVTAEGTGWLWQQRPEAGGEGRAAGGGAMRGKARQVGPGHPPASSHRPRPCQADKHSTTLPLSRSDGGPPAPATSRRGERLRRPPRQMVGSPAAYSLPLLLPGCLPSLSALPPHRPASAAAAFPRRTKALLPPAWAAPPRHSAQRGRSAAAAALTALRSAPPPRCGALGCPRRYPIPGLALAPAALTSSSFLLLAGPWCAALGRPQPSGLAAWQHLRTGGDTRSRLRTLPLRFPRAGVRLASLLLQLLNEGFGATSLPLEQLLCFDAASLPSRRWVALQRARCGARLFAPQASELPGEPSPAGPLQAGAPPEGGGRSPTPRLLPGSAAGYRLLSRPWRFSLPAARKRQGEMSAQLVVVACWKSQISELWFSFPCKKSYQ